MMMMRMMMLRTKTLDFTSSTWMRSTEPISIAGVFCACNRRSLRMLFSLTLMVLPERVSSFSSSALSLTSSTAIRTQIPRKVLILHIVCVCVCVRAR